MNTIIDFFKRMFGLKPNRVTTVVTKKSKPEIENISKNHKRSDLNEISLKMNTGNSKPVVS
jgi:ribosomal protein L23